MVTGLLLVVLYYQSIKLLLNNVSGKLIDSLLEAFLLSYAVVLSHTD